MASEKEGRRFSSAGRKRRSEKRVVLPGHEARGEGVKLRTYQIGALPVLHHFLGRMKLDELLRQYLPPDDPRVELPTSRALLVLVRNILLSREPIYGVGDWSAHFAPDLLDLFQDQLSLLQDDRLGRCLDRMFEGAGPDFILGVVRHVIREFSVSLDELHNDSTTVSFQGAYRLFWYHSTRKQELDRARRLERLERAQRELRELNVRLTSPRTRFRQRSKVEAAVAKILSACQVESLLNVEVSELTSPSYKQATPGRPSPQTQYVRRERLCFLTSAEANRAAVAEAEREDGVFPLLTNDRHLSADEVLRAYKRQPLIEKRFSQFKTDFAVAPVYLKNVARVQGLLAVYFLVLLVQTLLERELRLALQRTGQEFLPLYPESRPCRRPTTRRVLDAFESVQRHVITLPSGEEQMMVTELTELQRQILELLQLSPDAYGR